MPCADITDSLKIQFDPDDRILMYALHKQTCGGEVGSKALIAPWLKGKSIEEVLAARAADVLKAHQPVSEFHEFLITKHFLVVQAALAVMSGQQPGGISDYCRIEMVEYDETGTRLKARIRIDAMTEEIRACEACCQVSRSRR